MNAGPLDGKVALVTGASRGIGRAIALELAQQGAKVALNYRSGEAEARAVAAEIVALRKQAPLARNNGNVQPEQGALDSSTVLSELAAGANVAASKTAVMVAPIRGNRPEMAVDDIVMLAQADVSRAPEARGLVDQVVQRWGRLDILVNNAGITRDRTLRKLTDEDWLAVINNNLNSVFFVSSAAIPVMIEQKCGRIVNISSLIAQAGAISQANYGAAKGGIIAFTKTAALELARHNVTVNCVVPGYTFTEMLSRVSEDLQNQIKAKIPMGRFATPEEIAKAVRFLTVDGDYITGQQLNVNGGLYM